MKEPQVVYQRILSGRGRRAQVFKDGLPLSWEEALRLLLSAPPFREHLTAWIAHAEFKALRWETPPITTGTIGRPFEFALIDAPHLDSDPEPQVFGPCFDQQPLDVDVLSVWNLGKTARLVVPREMAAPGVYVHLKAFLCGAPAAQVHSLWQCVALTALSQLSSRPLWVSTAGGGVNWLHVRIEGRPKYYAYRPFADGA